MTAFQIVGNKMNVTSSSTGFLATMFGTSDSTGTVRVSEFTMNQSGPTKDVTGALSGGVTARSYIGGLREATVDVVGFYPKTITAGPAATTPRLGNSALITCAAAELKYVTQYSLKFNFPEAEITTMQATALGWRRFRPSGVYSVSGNYTTLHASDAVLVGPITPGTGGTAATFKLTEDGTSDPAFTGSIIVQDGPRFTVNAGGGVVAANYGFVGDGAFTAVAGDTIPSLLAAGAVGMPEWDSNADGTPDIAVVFTAYTGRTYTANCLLTSLQIDANVGEPLKVTASLRVSDAIT